MSEVETASQQELQGLFDALNADVEKAQPLVTAMRTKLEEAEAVLNNMKHRRGRVAYWLTIRKGQR